MPAPALEIISRVRTLLQDEKTTWRQQSAYTDTEFGQDKYRWRANDLAIFVDEAQTEVCLRFPQANLRTEPMRVFSALQQQSTLESYFNRYSWSQGIVRVEANLVSTDGIWDYDQPPVTHEEQAAVFNSASYALSPTTPWANMKNGAVLVVVIQQYTGAAPTCAPSIPGLTTSFTWQRDIATGAIAAGYRRVTFKLFKVDAVPAPATLSLNVSGTVTAYASRVIYLQNVDYERTQADNPIGAVEAWNEWQTAFNTLMFPNAPVTTTSYPVPLSRAAQPSAGDYSIVICGTKANNSATVTCDGYPVDGVHVHTDNVWTVTNSPAATLAGFQLFGRSILAYFTEWEMAPSLYQTQMGSLIGGHFIIRRAPLALTVGDTIPMAQRDAVKSFYNYEQNDLYDSPTIPVEWYPAASETGKWFKAWSPDPTNPQAFYLFPLPSWVFGQQYRVLVTHMAMPAPVRNLDDRLTLSEQYWPALVYWVAYRALTMRTTTFNRALGRKYLKLFEEAVAQLREPVSALDQKEGRANALPW